MALRTATLAGASGLVGGHLLDRLLERYARVVVLGRRPLGRTDPRLTEHLIDFERLESAEAALFGDDVYCALGTTIKAAGSQAAFRRVDHDYVVALARRALAAGASRFFLVSALGADARSRVFYSRVKGEAEDAVAALPFRAVHVARPSLLLGRRAERRPAERVGQWLGRLAAPLFVGPLARYRAIEAADVAAALVDCAATDVEGVHFHYPASRRAQA